MPSVRRVHFPLKLTSYFNLEVGGVHTISPVLECLWKGRPCGPIRRWRIPQLRIRRSQRRYGTKTAYAAVLVPETVVVYPCD
jgi:hypothetical protein